MKSVTDIELLMLARLAARGEQVRGDSVEDLVAAGLLPRGFGRRPDGSGPVIAATRSLDSRRGARGTFTPIPDVQITGITRGEAARLEALNAQLASQWRRMDPLLVGIQRTALDDKGRERIVIDGNIAPLDETKYGWVLSMLGPPTRQMITTAAGRRRSRCRPPSAAACCLPRIPPHHLFLGIQDIPPLPQCRRRGLLQTLNLLRSTPGYIGSWPRAGFLDLLAVQPGRQRCPTPMAFRGCRSACGGGKAAASRCCRSIRSSWPTSRRSCAWSKPRSRPSFGCTSRTCRNRKSAPGSSACTISAA